MEHFTANDAVDRPFIYLSAGVSAETFRNELTFAGQSHTKYNGILGGRATWLEGVEVYAQKGRTGLLEWLNKQGRLLCQESGHKSTNKFDFQFKLLNLIFGGRSFSPVQILKTL